MKVKITLLNWFDYPDHTTYYRESIFPFVKKMEICHKCSSLVIESQILEMEWTIYIPLETINIIIVAGKEIYHRCPEVYENQTTYNKWKKKWRYI